MTDKQQPEALRLADALEEPLHDFPEPTTLEAEAAAELRRLHAENETLRVGYAAARLDIETLRKEHADELSIAYMCGASREKELAAQQTGTAYAALPECDATTVGLGEVWNRHSMRAFADATHALRAESLATAYREELDKLSQRNYELRHAASHGQAPAQAAPAAVAGSSDDLVTRESAMQAIEHLAISNSPGLEDDAIAMLAAAPTTQPATQQEVQANTKTHDLLGTMIGLFLGAKDKIGYKPGSVVDKVVAEAVEHLKDWPYPEPAPQQEAQEPVARLEIGKTKGGVSLTHIAEPAAFQLPEGMYALYTTPQPSPAAQGDAMDAEYQRGYRHGYEQRDAEVRGALV